MKYSPELRAVAIASHLVDGQTVAQIATNIGVPRSTLYNWIKKHLENQSSKIENQPPLTLQYLKHLESKVQRLDGMITILKTVPCTVHAPLSDRLNAIEQLQGQYLSLIHI